MPGSALQSNFTAGELSPSLSARVELAKYNTGCRTLKIPMRQRCESLNAAAAAAVVMWEMAR